MDITEAEIAKLLASKNRDEWNDICEEIKAIRNGSYPPDWWKKVMSSGVAAQAVENWTCGCGDHNHKHD